MGQMSYNKTADGDFKIMKDTIHDMAHNPEKWNACYSASLPSSSGPNVCNGNPKPCQS